MAAGTLAANCNIAIQGSYNNEITGLAAILGNSTELYGINRAANKWLQPQSYTSAGGAIDEVTIQKVIDDLDEVAGSQADFIVCSFGVKRAFQEYLSKTKMNIDILDLAGGYKALSYNGIPLVSDRFAPSGTMYILDSTEFHLHQLCDWRWLEGDDGRIIKQQPNKPVYNATLVKYADLICDKPSGQAVITGITEK